MLIYKGKKQQKNIIKILIAAMQMQTPISYVMYCPIHIKMEKKY